MGKKREQTPLEQTSSGEKLDVVLSSIRDSVTTHAQGGAEGRTSLALAFDDLRQEIAALREGLNEENLEKNREKNRALDLNEKELQELITQIAKPMLTAMLKSWIDTNLPPLAERVIREEIERLSRER